MKNMRKMYGMVLAILLTITLFAVPAGASGIEKYQNSVVCIGTTFEFKASNYNVGFTFSSTGTGFAVGKPGDDVQYIATCAHVVSQPSGIYTVTIDKETGEYLDYVQESEGTYHPASYNTKINGVDCVQVCDYFTVETVDLYAIFSSSSNDFITMTITQIDSDADLALCKLASSPTDKISPLPLQRKGDVEINTDILAIGYPSTSRVMNAENRMDAADSTVKDGIVSKLQRTPGRSAGSQNTIDTYEVTAELITGMSGGPVISEKTGAVIGVTSFGYVDVSQAAAARYAICIDYLIPMLEVEGVAFTETGFPLFWIVLAALLLAVGIIVIVVCLKKKTAAPAPAPEPAPAPTPVNTVKFHLNGVSGHHSGKRFGINGVVVIGRDSAKCNVVFPLDQPGISGVHCELRISGSDLTLKDCNSSYGTYLENGTKLEANVPVVLRSGSRFYVGSAGNMFEVEY